MKKCISILAIMFLIMSILIGTVSAASASVRVSSSNTSPKVDDTIIATITFSVPVGTAELRLNYNNSVLEYVSSNAWRAQNEGSAIKLSYIDTTYENKTISSMRVTFKVIGEGTSSLTASGIVLSNAQGEELSTSTSGTTVTVEKVVEEPEPDTNTTPSTPSTPSTPTTPSTPSTNTGTTTTDNNRPSNTTTNTNNTDDEVENNTVENETIENETNAITNEINNEIANQLTNNIVETDNEENKPNYLLYIILGIIGVAIIVIIVMIIKNKDEGGK